MDLVLEAIPYYVLIGGIAIAFMKGKRSYKKGYRQGVIKAETILKETQEKNT